MQAKIRQSHLISQISEMSVATDTDDFKSAANHWKLLQWVFSILFVAMAVVFSLSFPGWVQMWLIAGALWFGFKLTSMAMAGGWARIHPLFFLWVGMDAAAFSRDLRQRPLPSPLPMGKAVFFIVGGLILAIFACNPAWHPLLRGWLAVVAMLSLLHFGGFVVLASFWQKRGYPVAPLMDDPWQARNPGEFWGRRWNRGFSDWARKALFQPLVRRHGIAVGTMAGFLASGLIHELVISWPARGGFGGPTLYFLVQGGAVLFIRRLGNLPPRWRTAVTCLLVLLPAPLLFHVPFLTNVFIPMMDTFTATIQSHATD